MTTEERAKLYDEALEKAKKIYNFSSDIAEIKRMEEIFPELKESENERIRKRLIAMCKHYIECYALDPYNIDDYKEALAWLEKQDFYYTFEIKRGHWYKCVCDYMLNGSDLIFKNDRLYYCRSDWRLRGEIDERNVKDIGVNGYKSFFRPATNQEVLAWLEKQGEQKPVWSEEDGSILQGIWNEILANKHNAKECEWKTYDKFLNWLNSLKDRHTWKPSEEQIKVIEAVLTVSPQSSAMTSELIELYQQLKKLKG